MKKTELKKLTSDELREKEKNNKVLIGLFIIILALFYFALRGYFNGEQLDWPSLTIAICSVGGLLSVLPTLKAIQKEIKERGI